MVSDNYLPVKLIGNGTTHDFAFSFTIFSAANIRVYLEDVGTGVQTLQTVSTDYTMTFDDSTPGGNIHFITAPTSAYYVVIGREVPLTQEVPYTTSNGFQGSVVQGSFDKLTALVQDVREAINRAFLLPLGNLIGITIPTPEPGKFLKGNPAGDGYVNALLPDPSTLVKSTQLEAEAGTADDVYMTPLQVKHEVQKSGAVAIPVANITGAELVANKDTTVTLGTSDTKYPSQKAVKAYVDARDGIKIGQFSIDISTTGAQAVTGVGFTPRYIEFEFVVAGSVLVGRGKDDGTNHYSIFFNADASVWTDATLFSIYAIPGSTALFQGLVASFDADGFTITKSITGSPTGSMQVFFTAYK